MLLKFITKYTTLLPAVIIFFVMVISGCSATKNYSATELNKVSFNNLSVFKDNFNKAVYRTNIKIYKKELTGVTIIKNTDSSMRIVSMSELGIKYFDFEFPFSSKEEIIIHYIMQPLNSSLLVNMFKKDFSILFYMPRLSSCKIFTDNNSQDNFMIVQKKLLYLINSKGDVVEIKKHRNILKDNTIFNFTYDNQNYPGIISIAHNKIQLDFIEINN